MVGSNKILTVSYGTFSCTLEGFDDPFATMRSIAEYFRDLAADDRYFGAEPPTPDVEMLHRLAEREARRRVESRVEGNGVVLRPADEAMDEAEPAETATAQLSPARLATASPEEGIAEKLERIRAAVARSQTEAAPIPAYAEDDEPEALAATPGLGGAFAPTAVSATEPEHEPEPAVAVEAPGAMPFEDGVAAAGEADVEPFAEDETPSEDDDLAAALAAKLAAADTGTASAMDETGAALDAAAPQEPPLAEQPAPVTDMEEPADDLAGIALAAEQVAEPGPEGTAPAAPEEDPFDLSSLEIDTFFAQAAREDDDGADARRPETGPDSEVKHALASGDRDAADTGDAPEPLRLTPEQEVRTEAPAQPVRARVVKMRREEFEAAFEPETDTAGTAMGPDEPAAADQDEDVMARVRADLGTTGLSPEDEADLVAELAAAEREMPEAPAAEPRPRRVMPDSEASVDRILRQTNTELDRTDGNRRRSAIAHLKAAVAAIRAEGGQRDKGDGGEIGQYRADLARVVRPERPAPRGEAARAETVRDRRMPPLMLVSEQRIDKPAGSDGAPVQPRRVHREDASAARAEEQDPLRAAPPAAAPQPAPSPARETLLSEHADAGDYPEGDNIFVEDGPFADFLDDHEVRSLADLLEASAAFGTHAEGMKESSRSDIIKRVKDVMPEAVASREDTLRAFGVILREGRVQKTRRGFFTISPSSRFLPERRDSATG